MSRRDESKRLRKLEKEWLVRHDEWGIMGRKPTLEKVVVLCIVTALVICIVFLGLMTVGHLDCNGYPPKRLRDHELKGAPYDAGRVVLLEVTPGPKERGPGYPSYIWNIVGDRKSEMAKLTGRDIDLGIVLPVITHGLFSNE